MSEEIYTEEKNESGCEIVDEVKRCKFCNEEMEKDMMYCPVCGKYQLENRIVKTENFEEKDRKPFKPSTKRIKKKDRKLILVIFSYVSFFISFIGLATGLINSVADKGVSIASIFGSSSDALITALIGTVSGFSVSLIFLILGIFLNIKASLYHK